ncbi:MAG TPA: hypothetical protein VJB69_00390 [Candidatus Paceibacterota bacterium]
MLFLGNGEKKGHRQLLRILRKFPWLWAVKSSWLPNYGCVEIRRADKSFMLGKPQAPRQVWVKVCMYELQAVKYTIQRTDQTLANAVVEAICPGYHIEYVVVVITNDQDGHGKDFVILRAPSSGTLHHFCCEFGFSIYTFVPGRLVSDFVVNEEMERVAEELNSAWEGVIGYSLDGNWEDSIEKKGEVKQLLTLRGPELRVYLKPYSDLYQLVGEDQKRQHHSCLVGILDDELNRWRAVTSLFAYDKEKKEKKARLETQG